MSESRSVDCSSHLFLPRQNVCVCVSVSASASASVSVSRSVSVSVSLSVHARVRACAHTCPACLCQLFDAGFFQLRSFVALAWGSNVLVAWLSC